MSVERPRIVILGGGTAGWMAACLFKHHLPQASVTLVEAPEIATVGVGEGSTPQLAAFFRTLGIADADWMPAAQATYKLGIGFHGWSDAPGHASYFHPFVSALDRETEPAFHRATAARRAGEDVPAHPDGWFLASALAAAGKSPLGAGRGSTTVDHGYHFDAALLGGVLRDHAVAAGVRHLARRCDAVAISGDGEVEHLALNDGERLAGDLFVDASGFRATIAGEALGTRFLPFAANLFNDAAVVLPSPASAASLPATRATALSAGWAWSIPLRHRTGNGYVYSTRYLDPAAAEAELRGHLGIGEDVAARHLAMKVGRRETSWTGNCLAIGLAQGFIEPLEATALHIVQATVEGFVGAWRDGGFGPRHRDAFNRAIAARYEGVRDYIVAHYRMSRRADTAYWRDNAANPALSDALRGVLRTWFAGGDLPAEIARQGIGRFYAPLSWGCLLGGLGHYPAATRAAGETAAEALRIAALIRETAKAFPTLNPEPRMTQQDVAA